ncbi:hypothetical protein M0638_03915 [Roseomonas sp. NAR14]|uniref:Lipoprotein n=1 Tax=Roseomonas acroporae TaxID=2937791 RepID=A0A9X1YBP0_9PROT|nr:hypothetical protein [Roseomonas acroporae]MCK8783526.1 hypothetical protein [Roseomonas acroporae]
MRWAAALLPLGLAACASGPPAPVDIPTLAARLPQEAAGMIRGDTTPMETDPPGAALAVAYATANRAAAGQVQIFDDGAAAADPRAPEVAAQLDRTVQEALASAPNRGSQRLSVQEMNLVSAGGQPALRCATLRGNFGRTPIVTTLCVGGFSGHFLRLEVTMPDRGAPPVQPLDFATAIALAAKGTPQAAGQPIVAVTEALPLPAGTPVYEPPEPPAPRYYGAPARYHRSYRGRYVAPRSHYYQAPARRQYHAPVRAQAVPRAGAAPRATARAPARQATPSRRGH